MESFSTVRLDFLLTYCKIFHKFDTFGKDMIDLFDYYDDPIIKLDEVSRGKSNEFHAKLFYNKHKEILDIIKMEYGICDFLYCVFSQYGFFNDDFRMFYRYIKNNKESLNQIKDLLYKLKEIGIVNVTFNIMNNFRTLNCTISKDLRNNAFICYSNTIKFLPSNGDYINYKFDDCDYIIKVFPKDNNKNSEIILGDLLFDKDTLPESINLNDIFDSICSEYNKVICVDITLNNIVSLEKIIIDFNSIIDRLKCVLNSIDKDNLEYTSLYEELINKIIELENLRNNYENKMINELGISSDIVEHQKKLILN